MNKVMQFLSQIAREEAESTGLAPAQLWTLPSERWADSAALLAARRWRFSAIWAEQQASSFLVNALYEQQGQYVLLRCQLSGSLPSLPSITPYYPAANRLERHIQDLYGILFSGHPDPRPWIRHRAWQVADHPLLKEFPVAGQVILNPTPPDMHYPFLSATGESVYEIPVGPIHAGIIEPGHFRFQAVGETVLNLEAHLGYVHRGVEKIAEGRDAAGLARLAGRVAGDSTVAHTWAACRAMEQAAQLEIPPRAAWLRAIMAERERVANHLGDVGAICNDVAFSFINAQFSRLREDWQRVNAECFGHRMMMDKIIPAGVAADLNLEHIGLQQKQCRVMLAEVEELAEILDRHTGVEDRLATTGILSPELAQKLGCLGYVGRASGQEFDVRKHAAYFPYTKLNFQVTTLQASDVKARVLVRLEEIKSSLNLLLACLTQLPKGALSIPWQIPTQGAEGLGIIEGWRGEIVSFVRFGANGLISRYYPRDPSCMNWTALELMIRNNIVPDFPVCNKSVNAAYSGHDL